MKKKVSLAVFSEFILPKLKAIHPDGTALQAAIEEGYDITDTENGVEKKIKIDVKQLENPNAGADAGKEETVSAGAFSQFEKYMEGVFAKAAGKVSGFSANDIKVGRDRELDDPKAGFRDFTDYARSVKKYALEGVGSADEGVQRLRRIKAPTNYANEGTGADGGFLVPHDFGRTLMRYAVGEQSLLPLTRQITVSGNSITLPVDETLPWSTTGITASWTNEGAAKPESKPVFTEVTETLHKLTVLVPVTDELLQDSFISLGSYIADAAAERIQTKVNTAIVKGTGVGQPLGYRTSAAVKVVSGEGGQTADTINVTNLAKMFAAMPAGSLGRAVWLYNPAVLPQLITMTIGNQPIFFPNVANTPGATLFGRPAIAVQDMSILGDKGDIDFVDLSQYLTITKGTGIEQAVSIHLYFDKDITTFRFVLRIGGRPWMSGPWTGKDGVNTYSPFVTLNDR